MSGASMKSKRQFRRWVVLFFWLTSFCQTAYSQKCDPEIEPIQNWETQYRIRENRCEGIYNATVNREGIDVVGVTQGAFHFMLDKNEVMEISSPLIQDQPIQVRAVGILEKAYYRLDTRLEPGQMLSWPVGEVLYIAQFSAREIGVFGWIGEKTPEIYVPVAVATKIEPVANDGKIRLYLRPTVDIKNMKWRSAEPVKGVCPDMMGIEWVDAPKSSYREGTPVKIVLPSSTIGELCVEAAAQTQTGANWLKNKNIRVIVGK